MCAPVEQPSKWKGIRQNVPDANKSPDLHESFPQEAGTGHGIAAQPSCQATKLWRNIQWVAKCSLLVLQFCKFYWVMLPLFCICPFSVEGLDKSSGNIYHWITSYSTDKAIHLFLPPLCSQGLQAFLRHPSATCCCRKKKPQNSDFGFPLYFLFS